MLSAVSGLTEPFLRQPLSTRIGVFVPFGQSTGIFVAAVVEVFVAADSHDPNSGPSAVIT